MVGIDISGHTSNHVDEYRAQPFDLVVTVCDDARERCPVLPGAQRQLHRSFPDPARATGTADEIRTAFRRTRDQLAAFAADLRTDLTAQRRISDRAALQSAASASSNSAGTRPLSLSTVCGNRSGNAVQPGDVGWTVRPDSDRYWVQNGCVPHQPAVPCNLLPVHVRIKSVFCKRGICFLASTGDSARMHGMSYTYYAGDLFGPSNRVKRERMHTPILLSGTATTVALCAV